MNTPEFPAERMCRHSTTISRFVNFCRVRITPIGWPEQYRTPSFQVQVSGLPFTPAKSASPSVRQPGPVPSMKARGGG